MLAACNDDDCAHPAALAIDLQRLDDSQAWRLVRPGDEPVPLEGDVLSLAPRSPGGGAVVAGLLFDGSASPKVFAVAIDDLACAVTAWDRPLEPSEATVEVVLALPDGGLAIAGSIPGPAGEDDRDAWILRYGPGGNPVWELNQGGFLYVSEELKTPSREEIQALAWSGGDLVAAGAADINQALHSNWVLRIAPDGRLLNRTDLPRDDPRVPGELSALAVGPEGDLWLAGQLTPEEGASDAWLLRLDADAGLLWDRRYGESGRQSILAASVFQSDGGPALVLVGLQGDPPEDDAWIAAVDGRGTPLWSNVLKRQASGSERFAAVQAVPDGLVAAGRFASSDLATQAWLVRFDGEGRQSGGQAPAAGNVLAVLPWGGDAVLAGGSDGAGRPLLFLAAERP